MALSDADVQKQVSNSTIIEMILILNAAKMFWNVIKCEYLAKVKNVKTFLTLYTVDI